MLIIFQPTLFVREYVKWGRDLKGVSSLKSEKVLQNNIFLNKNLVFSSCIKTFFLSTMVKDKNKTT